MRIVTVATVVLVVAMGSAVFGQDTVKDDPLESGLIEQTQRRLMQIDVTARGPAETLSSLTEKDFTLRVGHKDITEFVLDRVCIGNGDIERLKPSARQTVQVTEAEETAPKLRTLLFFDQNHLTQAGRTRALELAYEVIPKLLRGGRSEAMIVSASNRMKVIRGWSSDPEALVAALDELARDATQMSSWADEEDTRVERLMAEIDRATELIDSARRGGNTEEANIAIEVAKIPPRMMARDLSREAASRTAAGLDLFNMALHHLDSYAPPKAVLYFADTTRSNAGDFYIKLIKATGKSAGVFRGKGSPVSASLVRLSEGNYVAEFQRSIDLAIEKGVRLYTVHGRGLIAAVPARTRIGSARTSSKAPRLGESRFTDAENALSGLALETGGKSFLGAADASQIATRILDDLSCLFVLSFHALELMKEDRRTAVWVDVDRPGVELQYRPRLIALSDAARRKGRLASAFGSGDRSRDKARVLAVPTGFARGKYTVLVQFAIPGFEESGSEWDMGVTAVVGQNRTINASGRVGVNRPGTSLVFEAEIRFKPGDYTITAVAWNGEYDQLISTTLEGTLPDPDDSETPFLAALAMLQRAPGAFVRGETTRTSGSLVHGPEHWLRPDRPTGILALVCGNKRAGTVTAGRSLVGISEETFDPVELDFGEDRCGLLVDRIDGNVMTSGRFSYAVALTRDSETLESSRRDFLVVSTEEVENARNDRGE